MKEIGWNDFVLINSFIKSLNLKLKTSLISIDLLKTLNIYTNVINKWYNDILRLTPKPVS
jgi:hypothetical protein